MTVCAKGHVAAIWKVVLLKTDASVAGRVVGSGGTPISGAEVFNRGDSPEPVATSNEDQVVESCHSVVEIVHTRIPRVHERTAGAPSDRRSS